MTPGFLSCSKKYAEQVALSSTNCTASQSYRSANSSGLELVLLPGNLEAGCLLPIVRRLSQIATGAMGHPSADTARRFKGCRYQTYRGDSQEKGRERTWQLGKAMEVGRQIGLEFLRARATQTQLLHASPHRLLSLDWVTAPAQQKTNPQESQPSFPASCSHKAAH